MDVKLFCREAYNTDVHVNCDVDREKSICAIKSFKTHISTALLKNGLSAFSTFEKNGKTASIENQETEYCDIS